MANIHFNVNLQGVLVFWVIAFMAYVLLAPMYEKHSAEKTHLQDEPLSLREMGDDFFSVLKVEHDLDAGKISLGHRLYHDKRLSPKGMACSSCHPVDNYGTLPIALSENLLGGKDWMNIPSTINAVRNANHGWLGEIENLSDQLDAVINNEKHTGSSWEFVINALIQDETYVEAFSTLFESGISKDTISESIVEYERSLITLDSPFDHFLAGHKEAITKQQQGLALFKSYGCIACHQGENIGGNLLAKFGIFKDPYKNKQMNEFDYGLYTLTKREEDRRVFRVPSLRNVSKTGPYFHDGSVANLLDVVRLMGLYQLGQEIPSEDVALIVSFLESLTAPIEDLDWNE